MHNLKSYIAPRTILSMSVSQDTDYRLPKQLQKLKLTKSSRVVTGLTFLRIRVPAFAAHTHLPTASKETEGGRIPAVTSQAPVDVLGTPLMVVRGQ